MENTDLYKLALERLTQSDTRTEWNDEKQDVPAVGEGERDGCKKWLRTIGFLRPGQDDEVWDTIKRNWIGFLAATSVIPDETLAPNRKVVRFTSGTASRKRVQRRGRKDFGTIASSVAGYRMLSGEGLTDWKR